MRTVLAVLAVVLCFFQPSPAFAQTKADAYKMSGVLEEISQEINRVRKNILEMSRGLPEAESDTATFLYDFTAVMEEQLSVLSMLGTLYSLMVHPKDEATARQIMVAYARTLNVPLITKAINERLGRLRSPPAIAEAQKLRDAIQRGQDVIRGTVAGK